MFEALYIITLVVGFAAFIAVIQLWQARGLPDGPAPALAGPGLDGRPASLDRMLAENGGKPVLVAFWATWCEACKFEEGSLESIARDWPILTVAIQSGEPDTIARHLKDRGRDFPAIADADGKIAEAWKVSGVPTHFIVDAQGNIRFRIVGFATGWGLRARLWWAGQ